MAGSRSHMSVGAHHADLSPWLGLLGAAFGKQTPEVDPDYIAAAQDYYENGGKFSTPELKAKFETGNMYKAPGFLGTMAGNPANQYNAETKQHALLTQMAQGGQVNMMAQENAIKAKEAPQVDPRFLELNAMAGGKPRSAVSPDLEMDFDNPELQLPFQTSNSGGNIENAKYLANREEKRQTQEFNVKEDTKKAINTVLSKNGLIPTPANIANYDTATAGNAIDAANSSYIAEPVKARAEIAKNNQTADFIAKNPEFLADENKAKLANIQANTAHIGTVTDKNTAEMGDIKEGTFRPVSGSPGVFQYFSGPKTENYEVNSYKDVKTGETKPLPFPVQERRTFPAGIQRFTNNVPSAPTNTLPRRVSPGNPYANRGSNNVAGASIGAPAASPILAKDPNAISAIPRQQTIDTQQPSQLDDVNDNSMKASVLYGAYFKALKAKGMSTPDADRTALQLTKQRYGQELMAK